MKSLDEFWEEPRGARIPADEIERLKKDVAIERLVTGAGIELQQHGADLIGLCPFHDDRRRLSW